MTPDAAAKPRIEHLSALLSAVPVNELCLVLSHYEEGIRTGKFLAVPMDTKTFTIKLLDEQGQATERTLPDEFVEVTDGWTAWLDKQRRESRYTIMKNTDTIATSEDRLGSVDDFAVLARLRRERLVQRDTVTAVRPKPKAAAKTSAAKATPAKSTPAKNGKGTSDGAAPGVTPATAPASQRATEPDAAAV